MGAIVLHRDLEAEVVHNYEHRLHDARVREIERWQARERELVKNVAAAVDARDKHQDAYRELLKKPLTETVEMPGGAVDYKGLNGLIDRLCCASSATGGIVGAHRPQWA